MTVRDMAGDGRRAAERAARLSYGRLLAFLARRSRDVAAAEDALADALRAAVETWPHAGVPDRPEAWLLTAAKRKLIDAARHDRVTAAAVEALQLIGEERGGRAIPDERLGLMFACSHPEIEASARTPLMLQTVLGLEAGRIASAFLVAPATMSQRLVRAKARIGEAGIAFAIPERDELASRLDAVLSAIYAAYGSGWDAIGGADPHGENLAEEAIWLGRVVCGLLPNEPEAAGLLALMLHCEARRAARRRDGVYIPLGWQDTAAWSPELIVEAERLLAAASREHRPARFQLEAAIQSVHARRAATGTTDWEAIALLYEGLVAIAPSIGAQVGRAAALAEARGAQQGLAALDAISANAVQTYQPYWATRAHLLRRLGRDAEAQPAYERAIGLSSDAAVRDFLVAQMEARG
jgi:RNA polymerase sigma-70 factor (ECF subfamily)